jgi:hypothetical protein
MYLSPTVGSWWSQWVVRAACHCCSWQRWRSGTLWGTLIRLWPHSLLCYVQSVVEISLQSHRHGFTEPHQVILMIIGFICLSIPMWTLPTAVQVIHVRSIIRFIVLCAAGCQCSQVDGHSCWCHSCRYATVWSHQSFSFTSPVWLQMGSRSKEYIISPYTSSMNDRNVQELGQC